MRGAQLTALICVFVWTVCASLRSIKHFDEHGDYVWGTLVERLKQYYREPSGNAEYHGLMMNIRIRARCAVVPHMTTEQSDLALFAAVHMRSARCLSTMLRRCRDTPGAEVVYENLATYALSRGDVDTALLIEDALKSMTAAIVVPISEPEQIAI
jgi:hypothetical protein